MAGSCPGGIWGTLRIRHAAILECVIDQGSLPDIVYALYNERQDNYHTATELARPTIGVKNTVTEHLPKLEMGLGTLKQVQTSEQDCHRSDGTRTFSKALEV